MSHKVIFTSNNARILYGDHPSIPSDSLINPDLSSVRGVPPHYWVTDGDLIREMTADEKLMRDQHISEFGVDNGNGILKNNSRQAPIQWPNVLAYVAGVISGILSNIIYQYFG